MKNPFIPGFVLIDKNQWTIRTPARLKKMDETDFSSYYWLDWLAWKLELMTSNFLLIMQMNLEKFKSLSSPSNYGLSNSKLDSLAIGHYFLDEFTQFQVDDKNWI